MYIRFKEFLKSMLSEDASNAETALNAEFIRWRASTEQIDDVCVTGIKI